MGKKREQNTCDMKTDGRQEGEGRVPSGDGAGD